ncbi:TIGR03790 family protein [Halieaceae bacterium IMCC14734]|uniref:TIGR03790 family protein n=2 Tax=Candidatus Litorirhabdus singularis TaxID=2518993 RepID=A0ABT3TE73_9GAMM|nr:TIGR03790 family protein [Candidatus Litorirhabdus singularis]
MSHAASAAITNANLALLVNDNDPQSVAVAKYYQESRLIPDENIIRLSFDHQKPSMSAAAFTKLREQVESKVPDEVQAYALTWTKPYKVACMSITSAFALGFDKAYCAQGCKTTRRLPYYGSSSGHPHRDFGIRPTMMLAGKDSNDVLQLIDRGVGADSSRPKGRAYLVSTPDKNRNVRAKIYPLIVSRMQDVVDIEVVQANYIQNKNDVLFYFTGLKNVRGLESNTYLPGAVADHLTSSGGALFGERQMSAMKWLEAGATGSYGTVTEPCNFPGKFPNPAILMHRYIGGDTLIEAYWKSVSMPGQGIFIGEPLASPFKGCRLRNGPTGKLVFEDIHAEPSCGP